MTNEQVMAAKEMVLRFLRLMEERDLDAAERLLDSQAQLTFPGSQVYSDQREMVAAAKGRYQWVKKTFDEVDAFENDGDQVVYVMGTLFGINRYGLPFEGIRYVDRFVVRNGQIVRQDVWNDLAEAGVLELRPAT